MKTFFKDYWKVLEVSFWWLKKHWIGYIIFFIIYFMTIWLYCAIKSGSLQYEIKKRKNKRKEKMNVK